MDLELKGKVAVVTGTSVGLGREIARVLAAEGARTIVIARRVWSFPAGPRMHHRALAGAGVAILVTGVMWQALDQIDLVILANAAPRHDVALYGLGARRLPYRAPISPM